MIPNFISKIKDLQNNLHRPVRIMEVCGTHTMVAFRSGLRSLLPEEISLVSGPGCPVCVTPSSYIDHSIAIAKQPDVTIATFGDMLRVPGQESSLEQARAKGANIEIVYSPLDAFEKAKNNPKNKIVFLGVGFETTVPSVAWTLKKAYEMNLPNYSVLCAHKTMPQAMKALTESHDLKIDGFLCPGHVSVVTGSDIFDFISNELNIPCVVTGFEPPDMIQGIGMVLAQIAEKRSQVEIQYKRCVTRKGNRLAQEIISEVFEPCSAPWRGIGEIPGSGLSIRKKYASYDTAKIFSNVPVPKSVENNDCRCGEVLRGSMTPLQCPLFSNVCTPLTPIGACMVSSEGCCSVYYKYAHRK